MVWIKIESLNTQDTNGITGANVVIAEYNTMMTSDVTYQGNKVIFVN